MPSCSRRSSATAATRSPRRRRTWPPRAYPCARCRHVSRRLRVSDASSPAAPEGGGDEVVRALGTQPGGRQLTLLAGERADVALVGGAVRDLLLGRSPRELDVVVAADAAAFAGELAEVLGATTTLHGRFGTAVVEWEAGRIDVAAGRAESYPSPGALPEGRP